MNTEATGHAPYDTLPESIKMRYSLQQFLWLSDDEKGRLIQTECEPETEL